MSIPPFNFSPHSPFYLLSPSLSHTHTHTHKMEEVSKKLAPILQVGDGHHSDSEEDKMADSVPAPSSKPVVAAPSAREKMEVREAIRGRKESVIVKETKVL